MTKEQKTYAKAMTMLVTYLQLAKMQADMLVAQKACKKEMKRKLKHTSEFCGSVSSTIGALGNMSKDDIIELAGEIDDIIRPALIEESDVR